MIFIWGSTLIGSIDRVDGIGYVATKFWHVFFIPLVPRGTFLVVGKEDGSGELTGGNMPLADLSIGWRGAPFKVIPVKFSFKSFLWSYPQVLARIIKVLLYLSPVIIFVFLISPPVTEDGETLSRWFVILMFALYVVFYSGMYFVIKAVFGTHTNPKKASPERTKKILDELHSIALSID